MKAIGRRRRRAERDGHGGLLGDAGRHGARRLPDPRQLRVRRGPGPEEARARRPRPPSRPPGRRTREDTEDGSPAARPRSCSPFPPPAACSGPTTSGRRSSRRSTGATPRRSTPPRSPTRPGGSSSTTRSCRSCIRVALVENRDLQDRRRARGGGARPLRLRRAPTSIRSSISPRRAESSSPSRLALSPIPERRRQQLGVLRRLRLALLGDRPLRPAPPRQRGGARADARRRGDAARRGAGAGRRRRVGLRRAARRRPAARDLAPHARVAAANTSTSRRRASRAA